jgi:uncharacterized protein
MRSTTRPTIVAAVLLATVLLAGCSIPSPAPTITATAPALPGGPARTETVTITRADTELVGTLVVPELEAGERVPVAILMHGFRSGREELHLVRTAEKLAAQGIASVRFDFTGHGLSDGEIAAFDDQARIELDDARAIDTYTRALPFVDGVSLVGYSLGGLVAASTAGEIGEVDSVVLLAPAPPYGTALPVYDTASAYDGPVLILQGDADELIPVQVAERYAAAFEGAELRILPHENHAFSYGTDVSALTVEFVTAHAG